MALQAAASTEPKHVPKETHEAYSFYYYSDDGVFQEYKRPELVQNKHVSKTVSGFSSPRHYSHSSKEADSPPKLLFPTEEIESLGRTDDQRKTRNEKDL